jgi:hypothetical protein
VLARGILDSYRQDKALAETNAAKLDKSADEETCPVDCVRDIFTGLEKLACIVESQNRLKFATVTVIPCPDCTLKGVLREPTIVECTQWRSLMKSWRELDKTP